MSDEERRPRILIVDDEPDMVAMLRRMLRGTYDCVGVTSVEVALERFRTDHFDVAIVDQRLPGGTGTALLARFAELNPLTRRISISGHVEQDDLMSAINVARVFRFLLKPVDRDSLLGAVAEALDDRRRQREALTAALVNQFGTAQTPPPEPETAPRLSRRGRPEGWPAGPGVFRLDPGDPEPLADLLAPEIEVGLASLRPANQLDGDEALAWGAEMELRLVTSLRDSDHSFRIHDTRFVVAFAHTRADGCARACRRIAQDLPGGLEVEVCAWPVDAPNRESLVLARRIITGTGP